MEGFREGEYTHDLYIGYNNPSTLIKGPHFDEITKQWEEAKTNTPDMLPWLIVQLHKLSPVFAVMMDNELMLFPRKEVEEHQVRGVYISKTYGRKGLLAEVGESMQITLPAMANVHFPEVVPSAVTIKSTGPNQLDEAMNISYISDPKYVKGFGADIHQERSIIETLSKSYQIFDTDGSEIEQIFIPGRHLITALPAEIIKIGNTLINLKDKRMEGLLPLITGKNLMHSMLFIQHTAYSFRDIKNVLRTTRKEGDPERGVVSILNYLHKHLSSHPYFNDGLQYDLSIDRGRMEYLAFLFTRDFQKIFHEAQIFVQAGIERAVRHNQNKHFEGMTDYDRWKIIPTTDFDTRLWAILNAETTLSTDLIDSFKLNLNETQQKLFKNFFFDMLPQNRLPLAPNIIGVYTDKT